MQASQYEVLMTSLVMTPTSTRAFCINGVCCWQLLPQLSRGKTKYTIKQLLTIEVLDMALISPLSIVLFSGGYHVISNIIIGNNCILMKPTWKNDPVFEQATHLCTGSKKSDSTQNAASDQGLQCMYQIQDFFVKKVIKLTRHPVYWKWICA